MTQDKQPIWKPVSFLPVMSKLIDGTLKENEDFYQTLLKAKSEPHVLDNETLERVFKVYGEQKDDHWLYEEQVARWKELDLTPGTPFKEVDRLEKQLANIRKVLDLILSLAEELKKGTLDTVLAKTDEELGLEILENERPGPSFEQSGNRSEANPAGRQRVDLSPEQLQCASLIDEKVKKIIQTGGDNKKILTEMAAYFPDFMRLLKMSKPDEMNELIYRFDGFYHLAKTLEKLAAGIRSGDIKVPQI